MVLKFTMFAAGFEPATKALEELCSCPLNYAYMVLSEGIEPSSGGS